MKFDEAERKVFDTIICRECGKKFLDCRCPVLKKPGMGPEMPEEVKTDGKTDGV